MTATGSARHVVYWDIDGTLLTTSRAGVPALEDGAECVVGRRPDLSGMKTAGMTDRMIAATVLESMGHPSDPESSERMLAAYARALPGRLRDRRGRVLPGVLETLVALDDRPDVANALLTGNMRAGAEAKLRSYGLWTFFSTGGFAEDGFDRADIARAAVRRARRRHGSAATHGVLVGDTPYDVAAGREVGLRVVAVGSETHPLSELAALDPWWAVDRVPSADALLERMEDDRGA